MVSNARGLFFTGTLFWLILLPCLINAEDVNPAIPEIKQGVTGVSLFYLDGRDQEDLPQVVQKLNYGDTACKGSRTEIELRLRNTLNNIQQSGFSWVRLLFGPGGFKIYANRCNLDLSKVYPVISPQYVEEFNHLLQIIGEYNLNIELVLSGSKGFHDLKHDLQFFESVLTQLDMTHIKLIMLGGDVQPANNKRHATWLKTMFDVFARNPAYSHTPFSFDTVTYPDLAEFKQYVSWVNKHLPDLSIVPVNLYYRALPSGSSWQQYSKQITKYISAFRQIDNTSIIWVDEFGFRLSTSQEQTKLNAADQLAYYKGVIHATQCNGSNLITPLFAWAAGNDRYLADPGRDAKRTPFGLYDGYQNNQPVESISWQYIRKFNNSATPCDLF
jgi:hypothetical protein